MKTAIQILGRMIVSPLIFALYAVAYINLVFKGTLFFLRYGGEWVTYAKDDRATIHMIYAELKKNQPER